VLFLDYIRSWCLGGSPEVAMAAVKSLRSLVQYPKEAPEGRVLPNLGKRITELWKVAWEVWEGIGLGVIAGADENVGVTTPGGRPIAMGGATGVGTRILHGPFTQDTLTIYVSVFPNMYNVLKPTFGLFELRRLIGVLNGLLRYHTNPQ